MTDSRQAAKYQVEVVGLDYYQRQISCQAACPVRTDARGYVSAIASLDDEAGYVRARQPNPLASTCGRVCAAHCEKACRRGRLDGPVAIRALKRFLCEPYGVEALTRPAADGTQNRAGLAVLKGKTASLNLPPDSYTQLVKEGPEDNVSGAGKAIPVAVIGAGPAGLTAAHDLALMGHRVTVFEAAPAAGGMARLGIPEYRLPRDLLQAEIGEILDLGVELKLNSSLGTDFQLGDLKAQSFRAVFLAIGAHEDKGLDIPGAQLDGVLAAVDFLLNVNLGYNVELGDKVVVVGGGDVAVDAARIAVRLGDEVFPNLTEGALVTAMDAARGALRLGARDVHMVYRGSREEMRASEEELEGALEEGTVLHSSQTPKRILGTGGRVTGLETQTVRSEYDNGGRRTLVPVEGSESVIECSSVILAIGQQSDLRFIRPEDGIQISKQGTIAADAATLATTAPGIYAGGDVVYGPRTVIEAVADGHRAAQAIDNYLKEGRVKVVRRGRMTPVADAALPTTEHREQPRVSPPKISLDRRTGVSEVEMVYDAATAREQSQRCLKCHIQTVFDRELCILCGGCVDVCPKQCLKLVPLESLAGSPELTDWIQAQPETPGSAMIKDETRCIRCGLCARRCPVGAVTMEAFSFEEELVTTGDSA